MKFIDYFKIALTNLNKQALRSFLTILGVFITSVFIMYIFSINYVLKTVESNTSNNVLFKNIITVTRKNPTSLNSNLTRLTSDNITKLSTINGVTASNPYVNVLIPDIIFNNKPIISNFKIKGVDLKYGMEVPLYKNIDKIISGNLSSTAILINKDDLYKFGFKSPQDALGKTLTVSLNNINGILVPSFTDNYKISGVFKGNTSDSFDFIMNAENASKILGFIQQTPNFLNHFGYEGDILQIKNAAQVSQVQNAIEKLGFSSTSEFDNAITINQTMKRNEFLTIFLLVILIIISVFGIINTLSMAVHERRRSIGIMKSIGASKFNICILFLVESIYLGLIGTFAATLFNMLTVKNILLSLSFSTNIVNSFTIMPAYIFLIVIVFMTFVCALAGLIPALKAANINPIESINK